ncbi:tetratricopeptide repeat protein [bacterium]|nr:tetratricopeptide repeat protein [candidate division CSSED10-310 bacterium]
MKEEKQTDSRFSEWKETMKFNLTRVLFLTVSLVTGQRSVLAGIEKGWDHFKKQEYELAASEFERALEGGREEAVTREGLGWCYYWLGRYDQAEREFARALEMDPQLAGAGKGLTEVKKWRYIPFNNAWQLFNNKDYQNALAVFQSILEDTTNRLPAEELWKVHSGMGWCYYYLQNYTAAEKAFNRILAIYKDNEFALKGLGFSLYQLGRHQDSIKVLEKAAVAHPEWADVIAMIGWNMYAGKDYTGAVTRFEQALAVNAQYADAVYGQAWCSFQQGNQQRALGQFSNAVSLSPYHPSVYYLLDTIDATRSFWRLYGELAWSYYRAGDFISADTIFSRALERLPDDLDLHRGRAFCAFKSGDYQGAITRLEARFEATAKLPPVVESGWAADGTEYTVRTNAGSIMAWCHYYLGEFGRARGYFLRELETYPEWTDLYTGLGWCDLKEGKLESARAYFARALELNPYYTVALTGMSELKSIRYQAYNAAWNAYYAGDLKAALARFEALVHDGIDKLDEGDRWRVYSGLGWSRLGTGAFEEAERAFQSVLELSPDNLYALQGMARVALARDAWDDAEQWARRAGKEGEALPEVWSLHGWVAIGRSQAVRAEQAFAHALKLDKNNLEAQTGIAWCRLLQNRLDDARDEFQRMLGIDPNNKMALKGMTRIETMRKDVP